MSFDCASAQAKFALGIPVERAPEQAIDHGPRTDSSPRCRARRGGNRRLRSPARCRRRARRASSVLSPQDDFGDDAGVPRTAGGGDRPRDVIRENCRQDPPPPQPAAHPRLVAASRSSAAGRRAGNDVEQDVPLRAEDHQRAQPDIGIEAVGHDHHDRDRKQQIRRKRGEKLRDRLHQIGDARAQCRSRRRSAPRSARRARSARRPGTAWRVRAERPCRHRRASRRRDEAARSARAPPPPQRRGPRRSKCVIPCGRSRGACLAARRARPVVSARARATDRANGARQQIDQPRTAQHIEHPGSRRHRRRPPARSESDRPRRPAAGTAAGRRSGSRPAS